MLNAYLSGLITAAVVVTSAPCLFGNPAFACRTFGCYPALDSFSGMPSAPKFKGLPQAENPHFREAVLSDLKKGKNFAGAYRLVQVGCGTGCAMITIIDLRTGRVFADAPFGEIHFGPHQDPYGTISFQLNSRLLIVEGRIDGLSSLPARAYYEWRHQKLQLLHTVRLRKKTPTP